MTEHQLKARPIRDDILIHPIDDPDRTPSGELYVPESARLKRRTDQGIALALGPWCNGDISPGDHVIFNPYSGDKVSLETGGIFYFVPETHIVAILQDSDVVLMDTETTKRIISERLGEVRAKGQPIRELEDFLYSLEASLLDRVDSITLTEGFEWL